MYRKLPVIKKFKVRPLTTTGIDSECRAGDDIFNSYHREKLREFRQDKRKRTDTRRPSTSGLGEKQAQSPMQQVLDVLQDSNTWNNSPGYQKKHIHSSSLTSKYFNNDDPNTVDCQMLFGARVCTGGSSKTWTDNGKTSLPESVAPPESNNNLACPFLADPGKEVGSFYMKSIESKNSKMDMLNQIIASNDSPSLEEAFMNVLIESNRRLNAFAGLQEGWNYNLAHTENASQATQNAAPQSVTTRYVNDSFEAVGQDSKFDFSKTPIKSSSLVGKENNRTNFVVLSKLERQVDKRSMFTNAVERNKDTRHSNESNNSKESNRNSPVNVPKPEENVHKSVRGNRNDKIELADNKDLLTKSIQVERKDGLVEDFQRASKLKMSDAREDKENRVKVELEKVISTKAESQLASKVEKAVSETKDISKGDLQHIPNERMLKTEMDTKTATPLQNSSKREAFVEASKDDVSGPKKAVESEANQTMIASETEKEQTYKPLRDRIFTSVSTVNETVQARGVPEKSRLAEKMPTTPIPVVKEEQKRNESKAPRKTIIPKVEDERKKIFERAENIRSETRTWREIVAEKEEVSGMASKYVKDRTVEDIFEKHLEKYASLNQTVFQAKEPVLQLPTQEESIRKMQGLTYHRPGMTGQMELGPTIGKTSSEMEKTYKRPIVLEPPVDTYKQLQTASNDVWGGLEPAKGRELLNFCCRHNDGEPVPEREVNLCCRMPVESLPSQASVFERSTSQSPNRGKYALDTSWNPPKAKYSSLSGGGLTEQATTLEDMSEKCSFLDAFLHQKQIAINRPNSRSLFLTDQPQQSTLSESVYVDPHEKIPDLTNPRNYVFNNIENPQGILKYFNKRVASWNRNVLEDRKNYNLNDGYSRNIPSMYKNVHSYGSMRPSTPIAMSRRQFSTFRATKHAVATGRLHQWIQGKTFSISSAHLKKTPILSPPSNVPIPDLQKPPSAVKAPKIRGKEEFQPVAVRPPTPVAPQPIAEHNSFISFQPLTFGTYSFQTESMNYQQLPGQATLQEPVAPRPIAPPRPIQPPNLAAPSYQNFPSTPSNQSQPLTSNPLFAEPKTKVNINSAWSTYPAGYTAPPLELQPTAELQLQESTIRINPVIKETSSIPYTYATPNQSDQPSGSVGNNPQYPGSNLPNQKGAPPTGPSVSTPESTNVPQQKSDYAYDPSQVSYEEQSVPKMSHEKALDKKRQNPSTLTDPVKAMSFQSPLTFQPIDAQNAHQSQYSETYHQRYLQQQQLQNQQNQPYQQQQPRRAAETYNNQSKQMPVLLPDTPSPKPYGEPPSYSTVRQNVWLKTEKKEASVSNKAENISKDEVPKDQKKEQLREETKEKPLKETSEIQPYKSKKTLITTDKSVASKEKAEDFEKKDKLQKVPEPLKKKESDVNKAKKPDDKKGKVTIIKANSKSVRADKNKLLADKPFISASVLEDKKKMDIPLQDKLSKPPLEKEAPKPSFEIKVDKPIVERKPEKKSAASDKPPTTPKIKKEDIEKEKGEVTIVENTPKKQEPDKLEKPKSPKVTTIENYSITTTEKPRKSNLDDIDLPTLKNEKPVDKEVGIKPEQKIQVSKPMEKIEKSSVWDVEKDKIEKVKPADSDTTKNAEKPATSADMPLIKDYEIPTIKNDMKKEPAKETPAVKTSDKPSRDLEDGDKQKPQSDTSKEKAPKPPGGIMPSDKTLEKIIEKSEQKAMKPTIHIERDDSHPEDEAKK